MDWDMFGVVIEGMIFGGVIIITITRLSFNNYVLKNKSRTLKIGVEMVGFYIKLVYVIYPRRKHIVTLLHLPVAHSQANRAIQSDLCHATWYVIQHPLK